MGTLTITAAARWSSRVPLLDARGEAGFRPPAGGRPYGNRSWAYPQIAPQTSGFVDDEEAVVAAEGCLGALAEVDGDLKVSGDGE